MRGRIDDVDARYIKYAKDAKDALPRSVARWPAWSSTALRRRLKVALEAFREVGAKVIKIGVEPNGLNILINTI
jgi:hypothetical protein